MGVFLPRGVGAGVLFLPPRGEGVRCPKGDFLPPLGEGVRIPYGIGVGRLPVVPLPYVIPLRPRTCWPWPVPVAIPGAVGIAVSVAGIPVVVILSGPEIP